MSRGLHRRPPTMRSLVLVAATASIWVVVTYELATAPEFSAARFVLSAITASMFLATAIEWTIIRALSDRTPARGTCEEVPPS